MKKILIVEDEDLLRHNTVKMLALTDFPDKTEVKDFNNATDALMAVKQFAPDLIISDFLMPLMDGKEFVGHLREMDECKTTPVILLSAKPYVADAFNDIHIDFLMKPFLYKNLIGLIEKRLFTVI
jgi:DNA-binding NtrC family response regulator